MPEPLDILAAALTGAITSLVVTPLTQYLIYIRERKTQQAEEREDLRRKYLNPLRLSLEEVHFRLGRIVSQVRSNNDSEREEAKRILIEVPPEKISSQPSEWFNGDGCHLLSSCYLTARLFFHLSGLREQWPYIRLNRKDDTKLGSLIVGVGRRFSEDLAIFYATQPSIGMDIYVAKEKRLMSYREYCDLLRDANKRVWHDRLLYFFIDAGNGKEDRLEHTQATLRELSEFLDKAVGGGKSISSREAVEAKKE